MMMLMMMMTTTTMAVIGSLFYFFVETRVILERSEGVKVRMTLFTLVRSQRRRRRRRQISTAVVLGRAVQLGQGQIGRRLLLLRNTAVLFFDVPLQFSSRFKLVVALLASQHVVVNVKQNVGLETGVSRKGLAAVRTLVL